MGKKFICSFNKDLKSLWNQYFTEKIEYLLTLSLPGSLEMYEIGDLSGKFGFLRGKSSVRGVWTDTNLPIYGANAIVGRSVVIHRDDATGSRLTCTSIEPKGAEQLTGTIDFTSNKDSVLEGSVIMVKVLFILR